MPRDFCLKDAKYCLLTYAQTPPGFNYWNILDICTNLQAECLIGEELHQDGGKHYHVFVDFGRKFSSRVTELFDIGNIHPNIERVGRTPWCAFDYVTKDGNVVAGGATRPIEGHHKPENDKWETITSAESRDDYFRLLHELAPKQLITSFPSICKYADWKFAPRPILYETPPEWTFDIHAYDDLGAWVSGNIRVNKGRGAMAR